MKKMSRKGFLSLVLLFAFLLTNFSPVFAEVNDVQTAPETEITETISSDAATEVPAEEKEEPASTEAEPSAPVEEIAEESNEATVSEPEEEKEPVSEPESALEPQDVPAIAEPLPPAEPKPVKEPEIVEVPEVEAPEATAPDIPVTSEPEAPVVPEKGEEKDPLPVVQPAVVAPQLVTVEPTVVTPGCNPNPGYYTTDISYIALCAYFGNQSTNNHTEPERLWVQGGRVFVAVKSTHLLDNIQVNGIDGRLEEFYLPWIKVHVDGHELDLTGLNGNIKYSHWTIYSWPISTFNIGSPNMMYVDGIGGCHDVTDTIEVTIPETKLMITKQWLGINPPAGTKVTFNIYGMPANYKLKEASITYPDLSVTVDVPVSTNTGQMHTHYKITENGITGYESNAPVNSVQTDEKVTTTTCGITREFFKHAATVVNTPSPIDVSVEKKWVNGDSLWAEITVQLTRHLDGEPSENVGLPELLNAGNSWKHTWNGRERVNEFGETWIYEVKESSIPEFFTPDTKHSVDGSGNYSFTITNTFTSPKGDVIGSKTWINGDPEDWSAVTLDLYRKVGMGDEEKVVATPVVVPDGMNKWVYTWKDLPLRNEKGEVYTYFVKEPTVPDNYISTARGLHVTNEFDVGKKDIPFEKIWDGGPSPRPDITIRLWADGQEVDHIVLEDGTVADSFKDKPIYNSDGSTIVYTISEDPVPGYLSSVDGFTVTNDFDEGKKDIPFSKIWDDGPTPRPDITIRLWADGIEVAHKVLSDGMLSDSFKDVPIYNSDGSTIVYTISEDPVPGYITSIDGFVVTNDFDEGLQDIPIIKVWVGGPTIKPSITIHLLADGEMVREVTLNNGTTEYTFEDLPIYRSNGTMIEYTLHEVDAEGYTSFIRGMTITNTFILGQRDIVVTKIWQGGPEVKPDITIYLWADGVKVREAVLKNGTTSYRFEDVPIFTMEGKEIVYTVSEAPVKDYKTTIQEMEITNTWTGELPNTGTTASALPILGAAFALGGLALTFGKKMRRK
ncbi:Cna B-type domain-containing protein [Proteiniclasticum sp. QWL-01]|uniref:Cna B-type domain-containing protein n=1 Tax=Proteiniclasticum sp. QWL-01 TaxID=3036945 RepID=UPI00240F788A|nr:Cna B-type domain-containing protein [Proteiniclasticum sp. QWL-01]WFF71933.1 Cna B-type domain-containing protein [Proteiniclasticum sp. QWL-01]